MDKIFIKADLAVEETTEEKGRITGYASVFSVEDSYSEVIEPGAFDYVLKNIKSGVSKMPLMLINHEHYSGCPAGIWDFLDVDEKGLKISGLINTEIQAASDVYSSIKFAKDHGSDAHMGLSIGFYKDWNAYKWDNTTDIGHIFNILELPEVSIVNFPANPKSDITDIKRDSLLKDIEALSNVRDYEKFLRDAGNFSKKEAETLISRLKTLNNSKCDTLDDVSGYMDLMSNLDLILKRN